MKDYYGNNEYLINWENDGYSLKFDNYMGERIRSHMVKKADYLVICMGDPGASKLKKALEWRTKGGNAKIVSDYQLWQEFTGTAGIDDAANLPKQTPIAEAPKPEASKPKATKIEADTPFNMAPKYDVEVLRKIVPEGIDPEELARDLVSMSPEEVENTISAMQMTRKVQEEMAELKAAVEGQQRQEELARQAEEEERSKKRKSRLREKRNERSRKSEKNNLPSREERSRWIA